MNILAAAPVSVSLSPRPSELDFRRYIIEAKAPLSKYIIKSNVVSKISNDL